MTDTAATIQSLLGPDPTPEQQAAADALLAALTRLDEPEWPAWVMAGCRSRSATHLHQRTLDPLAWWECTTSRRRWSDLIDPRPLTDEERAEYGIPGECTRPHAEPITDELVEQCIKATGNFMYPSWARGVLRGAGHPEAGE